MDCVEVVGSRSQQEFGRNAAAVIGLPLPQGGQAPYPGSTRYLRNPRCENSGPGNL
jgi:hypothetical protein